MTWKLVSFAGLAATALLLAACGSSSQNATQPADGGSDSAAEDSAPAGMPDASDAGADVGYPAPHYAMPQVVNVFGGNVLATPKIYLVYYPGYPYTLQLQAMAAALGPSTYWAAITKDYGVGAISVAGGLELTGETPPAAVQDSDIQAYLGGKLTSGALGTPDPSTIYTIFYPSTTTITLPQGGPFGTATSCKTFGGYHSDFALSVTDGGQPQNFAYAVIPTCTGLDGLTEQDGVTGAVSHEWIEAATDPFPSTDNSADSAYAQVDYDHFVWELLGGGGEVGDMCVGEQAPFYEPTDVGFTAQRIWSNSSAKAGHDPCVPNVPGTTYFQSAPRLTQNITFNSPLLGGTLDTQGVTIPVGQSKTIEVDLFSDGPTSGPWTVSAVDALASELGTAPTLSFKWDKTQGQNGDKLNLTVTVTAADTAFSGGHPFVITSTLGTQKNLWAALIVE
ncbi:MAG TPA: hypothetical protein VGL81_09650 [Polyangiaceae bacterium]|jgi:hypothetical protein